MNIQKVVIRIHLYFKIRSSKYARLVNPYYGLNNLDQSISQFIGTENGLYIEIGGNDGINQSNTKYFEQQFGWSGILIEADPKQFKKMKRNRSTNNHFANFACVSFEFKDSKISLIRGNLMSSVVDKNNHIQDPIAHAGTDQSNHRKPSSILEVPVTTLTNILDQLKISEPIKFMSLDVEGYELEVLKGLDFEKYRVEWICVEIREFEILNNFLVTQGYTYISKLSFHDYLYRKKD